LTIFPPRPLLSLEMKRGNRKVKAKAAAAAAAAAMLVDRSIGHLSRKKWGEEKETLANKKIKGEVVYEGHSIQTWRKCRVNLSFLKKSRNV